MDWKEQFHNMLGEPDTAKLDIMGAQRFKIRNMPSFLYKYRSPTEEALDNLRDDTVWLSSASKYNDPFEFRDRADYDKMNALVGGQMKPQTIEGLTKDRPVPKEVLDQANLSEEPEMVIAKYQLEHYEKQPPGIVDKLLQNLKDIVRKQTIKGYTSKNLFIQDTMKVCSFSECKDELLMWGHYTGNHKGFCVEYEIGRWSAGDVRRMLMHPVVYKKSVPDATAHILNAIRGKDFNNLFPIVSGSTKSPDWSYEKEWRFIFNVGQSMEEQNYRMDCQSAVFLGHRMDAEYRRKVLKMCELNQLNAFEATPLDSQYGMSFEEIKLNPQ